MWTQPFALGSLNASAMAALGTQAWANGKVILGGEHAVVHGCPALALGIPRALELRCSPGEDPQSLVLRVPTWSLDRRFLAKSDAKQDRLEQAVLAIFREAGVQPWGYTIQGDTPLPAGAGLGSSAALCVALAKLALGPEVSDGDVFFLSMVGEAVFHGDPSGIDSELALHGGLLRFTKGQASEPLSLGHPLRLWVISSKQSRQSADLVAKVQARMQRLPGLAAPTWDLFSAQVSGMQECLLGNDLERLGEIMHMQHHLLATLGVSTPTLDSLVHCAMQAGALGAKLTGAGGGGCVLVLPPACPGPFASSLQKAMQRTMGAEYPNFPLEVPAS